MNHPARVLTHPAAARERFRQLALTPEADLDLAEASLVIALEEVPSLAVSSYLATVDGWGEAVRGRLAGSTDVERILDEVNRLLFREEGFHGEGELEYDPRHAFINEVLDRHAGLPLALSILYIEVSKRVGLSVSGVSLPGRFLVKVSGPFGEILVDPFDEGRVLTRIECQAIMDQVFGGAVRLREHHLRSCSSRQILMRLLAYLKSAHLSRQNLEGAVAAIDRLLILDEHDGWEIRDRGQLAMQLHRYGEAIAFLRRYLDGAPNAADGTRVREQIEWLEAWLDPN